MEWLDLTLPTPEGNLALDEALLEACDQGAGPEVLRVWEPATVFVVVGHGNRVAREVDLERCRANGVPVLRRVSGGGAVVQMPGCLAYGVVLRLDNDGVREGITATHRYVLGRVAEAVSACGGRPVLLRGDSDLAIGERKCCGNAQRRLRRAVMVHGTLLVTADLDWIDRLLPMPSRQPEYRGARAHHDFVVNLGIPAETLKASLRAAWGATAVMAMWPEAATAALVREKYAGAAWNLKY